MSDYQTNAQLLALKDEEIDQLKAEILRLKEELAHYQHPKEVY